MNGIDFSPIGSRQTHVGQYVVLGVVHKPGKLAGTRPEPVGLGERRADPTIFYKPSDGHMVS
jgi:hypothetical protein